MDCARFDLSLDALLDGTCTPAEWEQAEAHAVACHRCGPLLDAMAGRGAEQDAVDARALTASIVARTSGNTCISTRDRLCDLADGNLGPIDRELVEGHLSRCEPCTQLAGALALTTAVLPGFAELAAPAALLPAVVMATSHRPATSTLADGMAGWLERVAARPRFSLEAAYVCTLLIALAIGDPVAAFKDTSSRGLAYAQPRVEVMVGRVAAGPLDTARQIRAGVAERARSVASTPDGGIIARAAARLDAEWQWVNENIIRRARAFVGRIQGWASAALKENHFFSRRVTQTEGKTEQPHR